MRWLRRWALALALVIIVVAYVVAKLLTDDPAGLFWAGLLLPAAWVFSPWFFPSRRRRADALAEPNRVAIYFRPGDIWCMKLRLGLGGIAKQALWIDAIADPEAEAWTREINKGDLLVPTVVIGDQIRRNPDTHWVGRHLLDEQEKHQNDNET